MAQIADRLTHPRDQAESGRERTRDKNPKEQLLHDFDQHHALLPADWFDQETD